jgi:hypothetical protein
MHLAAFLVGEGLGAFAGGEGGNGRAHGAALLGAHHVEGFLASIQAPLGWFQSVWSMACT